MRDHLRKGGAPTRTQWALNKCPFSPSLLPSRAPPASASAGHTPAAGRSLPRWVGKPLSPASRRLSPAALGSRRPLGQGGAGDPVFFSGEAPSPSPGTAGTWQVRLAGPPGSGLVRLSNPPGTLQGALDPGRGFLGARRREVRSTGSELLTVQVSEKEAEGVRAPVHSVGVLGTACVIPGRRAPTPAAKGWERAPNRGPVWWARSVPPRCTQSGSCARESRPRRPGPWGWKRPVADAGARAGGSGRDAGEEPRGPEPGGEVFPVPDSARSAKWGGPRRGG